MPALSNPFSLFVAQAALILLATRLVGQAARRFRQPIVVAELVAGVALGPSVLGSVSPHFFETLFPKTSLSLLGMFSQVGLVLFMFLVGLQVDPRLLRGSRRATAIVAQVDVIVSVATGALVGHVLYSKLGPHSVPLPVFVLFITVAMTITAFPILARILVDGRLFRSPIGAITIASSVIGNLVAWTILAFVVSLSRASSPIGAVRATFLALAYVATMIGLGRPLLRWLANRVRSDAKNFIAVPLLLLLASCEVSELLGIQAPLGALLLGALFPKEEGFARRLAEKIEDLVVVFLLPFFFAHSGMRTDLSLLSGSTALAMCALVVVSASVAKIGGAAIAARFGDLSWRDSTVVGVLLNSRGIVELIVLNIGLDLGILPPTIFAMFVVMTLVTTASAGPLLAWIRPAALGAHEIVEYSTTKASFHPPSSTDFNVLMCVDAERSAFGLMNVAGGLLGGDADHTQVFALRLVPPGAIAASALQSSDSSSPDEEIAHLVTYARTIDLSLRALSFVSAQPARDICDIAEVKQATVILVEARYQVASARPIDDLLLRAKADVAVLIDRGLGKARKLLVPVSGEEYDRAALRLAARVARQDKAAITLLCTDGNAIDGADLQELGLESLELEQKIVTDGSREAVMKEAGRGYDLVVVPTDPRSTDLSSASLEESPVSVLLVRGFDPDVHVKSAAEAFSSIPVPDERSTMPLHRDGSCT